MGFKIKADDLTGGGRGKPLPNGKYLVTIESAGPETKDNGTQLAVQCGNIRLPDGAGEFEQRDGTTYRIGQRKLFDRQWWDHKNEQAQAIGQRMIARQAVALGLMEKPEKGAEVEFPYEDVGEYADAIVGKDVIVVTRLKAKANASGPVRDEDGAVVMEPQIVEWLAL